MLQASNPYSHSIHFALGEAEIKSALRAEGIDPRHHGIGINPDGNGYRVSASTPFVRNEVIRIVTAAYPEAEYRVGPSTCYGKELK